MALLLHFVTVLFLSISITLPTSAEEFRVGGNEGWRTLSPNETEMYNHWASIMRFNIGDSLRFEYKNDTVQVVDKWGYYHCDSNHHTISVFRDGNTVIKLDHSGPTYFTSADPEHCKNGQRLMVEVIADHSDSPWPSPSSSSAESLYFESKLIVLFSVLAFALINM